MNSKSVEDRIEFIFEKLKNAKKKNILAHSYIIYCDNRDLREKLSIKLAKLIACKDLQNSPCNKCVNCNDLEEKKYHDLFTLEPLSKSRKILIGKDDDDYNTMRWFQSNFFLSSLKVNNPKIGIIYDADRLMPEAQNSFLKTLEEPPKNTYFILATEKPKALLPTIISRCQMLSLVVNDIEFDFNNSELLFKFLSDIIKTEDKSLSFALDAADKLSELFNSLKLEAEESVNKIKVNEINNSMQLEDLQRKKFNEKLDAMTTAQYLLLREKFLSAIYDWFSFLYWHSLGVNDLFEKYGSIIQTGAIKSANITTEKAEFYIKAVEVFLSSLRWNVVESLAIKKFVFDIIFKLDNYEKRGCF